MPPTSSPYSSTESADALGAVGRDLRRVVGEHAHLAGVGKGRQVGPGGPGAALADRCHVAEQVALACELGVDPPRKCGDAGVIEHWRAREEQRGAHGTEGGVGRHQLLGPLGVVAELVVVDRVEDEVAAVDAAFAVAPGEVGLDALVVVVADVRAEWVAGDGGDRPEADLLIGDARCVDGHEGVSIALAAAALTTARLDFVRRRGGARVRVLVAVTGVSA